MDTHEMDVMIAVITQAQEPLLQEVRDLATRVSALETTPAAPAAPTPEEAPMTTRKTITRHVTPEDVNAEFARRAQNKLIPKVDHPTQKVGSGPRKGQPRKYRPGAKHGAPGISQLRNEQLAGLLNAQVQEYRGTKNDWIFIPA